MPTLGGHLMVCRGNKLDYCWVEAIQSLLPICDEFALLLFSDDDLATFSERFTDDEKKRIMVRKLTEADFDGRPGKERLPYFTNMSKELLRTEWQFHIQADEVLHEDTLWAVKEAINKPIAEAYAVQRRSTWGDAYHYINYRNMLSDWQSLNIILTVMRRV